MNARQSGWRMVAEMKTAREEAERQKDRAERRKEVRKPILGNKRHREA